MHCHAASSKIAMLLINKVRALHYAIYTSPNFYYPAALAFNVHECAGVNVSIPSTIGCVSGISSTAGGKVTTTVEVAVSEATTAVATFAGGKIFTGSCTSVQFASAAMNPGPTLEYPWLGCSDEEPGCCPFDVKVGGALSVCPADYITTQGGCCPS